MIPRASEGIALGKERGAMGSEPWKQGARSLGGTERRACWRVQACSRLLSGDSLSWPFHQSYRSSYSFSLVLLGWLFVRFLGLFDFEYRV